MFKVVVVTDKKSTAIDRLASGMIPYMDNIDYVICDVHPKRPDPEQLARFEQEAKTADVIDAQYYRSADMLRVKYQWMQNIPTILTHHNPYAIKERDWNDYEVVVCNNRTIYENLKNITNSRVERIGNAVDPYFWQFKEEYSFDRSVIMVANRIESKKGILPVAKACKEVGAKMYLVGSISDPNYWHEVMAVGNVEFAQNISDEELRDLYHKSGIHVCNSIDNFESGTNPILEAIFCGVPVLTRMIGHVPDFYEKENLAIQDSEPEDTERIAQLLEELFSDKKKLETMRREAWKAIKDRNFERRAYAYQRLYREVIAGEPVSIIVPVADKPEVTKKCLDAILNQTHKNLEIIVSDDGDEPQHETIKEISKTAGVPIRYIRLGEKGYNLAKARNLAAIEATSDILVFCDQRMIMHSNAVEEFVKNLKPRHWIYGSKGVRKDFVENFSCITRTDFITMGMFNERCDRYGSMSQECRSRARRQGIITKYIESAKATPEGKSRNKYVKRYEIMESKNMLWKAGLQ